MINKRRYHILSTDWLCGFPSLWKGEHGEKNQCFALNIQRTESPGVFKALPLLKESNSCQLCF